MFRNAVEPADRGRHTHALLYLKQAVIIAPAYTRAFLEMGRCLEELGRYEDALEKYDRALKIDPSCSETGKRKARILAKIGYSILGELYGEQAARTEPNNAMAQFSCAKTETGR